MTYTATLSQARHEALTTPLSTLLQLISQSRLSCTRPSRTHQVDLLEMTPTSHDVARFTRAKRLKHDGRPGPFVP